MSLGIGEWRAFVFERGGEVELGEVPFFSTSGTLRRLDEISDATISVPMAHVGDDLCVLLGDLAPWEHEVGLFRDGDLAWVGPVFEPAFTEDASSVACRDLFSWFERRVIHRSHVHEDQDLAVIFNDYALDALEPDPSPSIIVAGASRTGIIGSRWVLDADHRRAADELRALSRDGLDFTMYGRHLLLGGEEIATTAAATLVTDDLEDATVRLLGSQQATRWYVLGGHRFDTQDLVKAVDGDVTDRYGLIEEVAQEPSILDPTSAHAAAATRLDLTRDAPLLLTATLSPQAPITFAELVPGARIDVSAEVGCRSIIDTFRLLDVRVDLDVSEAGASERITVSLSNLGTVSGS